MVVLAVACESSSRPEAPGLADSGGPDVTIPVGDAGKPNPEPDARDASDASNRETDASDAGDASTTNDVSNTNDAGEAGHGFAPRPAYRPETKFERRAIDAGRPIFDLIFSRR